VKQTTVKIVQESSCPACISPLQSGENTGGRAIKPVGVSGAISVTSYVPSPRDTGVPVDEPGNELGSGLLPAKLIVNSDGDGQAKPSGHLTSLNTFRVGVCGRDGSWTSSLFMEIKNDLTPFVKLYRLLERNKMLDEKKILRFIKYADEDLPALEYRCHKLGSDAVELQFAKKQLGNEVAALRSNIFQPKACQKQCQKTSHKRDRLYRI